MRSRSFQKTLKNMYPPQGSVRAEFPAELEADVMANYKRRYATRRNTTSWRNATAWWNPRYPLARAAIACLLLITVLGVACELPTSSQVEMGQHANVRFVTGATNPGDSTFETQLREALAAVGAETVRIGVYQIDGGTTEIQVLAWGQHVSQEDVEAVITQQVGEEQVLTINFEALASTLHETLGQRIGRRVFGIDVKGETAEELRASILEQLAVQGFDGDTKVEVIDDGSMRKITVEAGTADGSRETINEIIIESPDN